jgi:hypothetical protein
LVSIRGASNDGLQAVFRATPSTGITEPSRGADRPTRIGTVSRGETYIFGVWARVGLILAVGGVVACATVRFTGQVKVDGRPFIPRECTAGSTEMFYGVDLKDTEGRVLRLAFAQKPPGLFPYPRPGESRPSVAALKGPGARDWDVVGPCGPLLVQRQGKGGLDGDVHLRCLSARHVVEGRLAFDNCF